MEHQNNWTRYTYPEAIIMTLVVSLIWVFYPGSITNGWNVFCCIVAHTLLVWVWIQAVRDSKKGN